MKRLMIGLLASLVTLVSGIAQAAIPTLTLTASPTSGLAPLSVTLTCSSTNAVSCNALDGSSGVKALSGSEVVTVSGTTTYTMSCKSDTGAVTVSWTPPTTNTDGSALTNLAKYWIYRATTSSGLATATPKEVLAPASSTQFTSLGIGTWYFGAKAVNANGVASDMSNIVSKAVVASAVTKSVTVTVDTKPNAPTLTTVNQYAYELVPDKWEGVRLGRVVGTVPIGTSCVEGAIVQQINGAYYEVPRDAVNITVKRVKSQILVAQCEYT